MVHVMRDERRCTPPLIEGSVLGRAWKSDVYLPHIYFLEPGLVPSWNVT
jgi:hypothetical protein